MVEGLRFSMLWLRIALLLIVIAGLFATMAGETIERKFLLGAVFSAVIGSLWAALLNFVRRSDISDWGEVTKNVAEAQNLINQSTYSVYRLRLFGLQPKPNIESMDILENLKSPVSISLFIMVSVALGLNPNFLDYVFSFQEQNLPLPKTVLFYLGFMFCLSSAFLGIFLVLIKQFHKAG